MGVGRIPEPQTPKDPELHATSVMINEQHHTSIQAPVRPLIHRVSVLYYSRLGLVAGYC